MRINLTKKDLVNLIYMQLGFSKKISENLIDDFFQTIIEDLIKEKKIKLSNFGTFSVREKNQDLVEIQKRNKKKLFQKEMLFYLNPQKNLKILLI